MAKKNGSKDSELALKKEFIWNEVIKSKKKFGNIMNFAQDYMDFLDSAKTERECVEHILEMLDENGGWKDLEKTDKIKKGGRYYIQNRNKGLALMVIGKKGLTEGLKIVGAHIDSPRLDLKQRPLFEDGDTKLAMLRTHYYGGIKKYQWVSRPLALHGIAILSNGKRVEINIGEEPEDPVFTIPDLLIHLYGEKQKSRKVAQAIKGEELLIMVGSIPVEGEKIKKRVKTNILKVLNKRYGIKEVDFISAELEAVPAERVREVGFDRSMIGGYGQDDRICSYTATRAIMDLKGVPERTALVLLFDKEEIGSEGNTGARSRFTEYAIGELLIRELKGKYNYQHLRRCLRNTKALSADVNGAVNPIFKDVHEKQNAAYLGKGICLTKFTGRRGKAGSSDANAEFVAEIIQMLTKKNIPWQTGELGKVDEGGGGTVAKFLAEHDMEVIDSGPAIMSMHSPFEVSSKADVYYTYRAYGAFLV